jgi:hypothetical protein
MIRKKSAVPCHPLAGRAPNSGGKNAHQDSMPGLYLKRHLYRGSHIILLAVCSAASAGLVSLHMDVRYFGIISTPLQSQ